MTTRQWLSLALVAAVWGAGCGGGFNQPGVGGGGAFEAGAASGGAQDWGLARKKIDAGEIPNAVDFPVEGLYAEHDLPLQGAACDTVLCLRGAAGSIRLLGAAEGSGRELFVQLGMSSNLDLETFRRQPLNLSVVVDRSGSMGDSKMEWVKQAIHHLVDQLGEADVLSIVLFDDQVDVLVEPIAVADKGPIHSAIDTVRSRGSTCIECGLKVGYEKVRAKLEAEGARSARVMLLTDALPNVGATRHGDFMELLGSAAAEGIGTSVFGVGLDFGQELAAKISSVRGAQFFFLQDEARIREVFDQDFDLLVTPIAYELELEVEGQGGAELAGTYGIPGQAPGERSAKAIVQTVFLSRRKGAIAARLSGAKPGALGARVQLSWSPVAGERVTQQLDLTMPAGDEASFEQPSVRKTFALTELAVEAAAACDAFQKGQRDEAKDRVRRVAVFLEGEAEALADEGLRREAALMRKLETRMGTASAATPATGG